MMSRILWRANSSGKRRGRIHDPVLADQDAVVQAAAARETHLLERLDLAKEAERACGCDLVLEAIGVGELKDVLLTADRRRVVEDVMDAEALGGLDAEVLAVALAVADLVAAVDDDLVDVPTLVLDAGALEQRAELRGGSVEDRNLGLHLHE
jgi:hypothetical protein